jgi:hypothetical protein
VERCTGRWQHRCLRIDAQDLAEQVARVLAVALGGMAGALIVRLAAVAGGDVEQVVGAEVHSATVVVELWLSDPHQLAGARRIHDGIGICRKRHAPFDDDTVAIGRGAVRDGKIRRYIGRLGGKRIKQSIALVARMEGNTEEAALVEGARTESTEPPFARAS